MNAAHIDQDLRFARRGS